LPELEPDVTSERIRQALPNWTAACNTCLQEQCTPEIQRCAAESDCADFVSCRWSAASNPSPTGALECEQRHGVSDEQPGSTVRALSNCWQNSCANACELGTRWECASAYAQPAPESTGVVTVRQVLQQLNSEQPVSGATVRFCDSLVPPGECDASFEAEGITDVSGIAAIDVPIATDHRPGWRGYGRVSLPDGGLMRLQSNLVLARSRFALQHVPSALEMVALQQLFRGQIDLGNVVFQVFDCAHTSAQGVFLEVSPDAPGAQIEAEGFQLGYLRGQAFGARLDGDGTQTEQGGGGAILNLKPNQWVWVSARLSTGQELARTRIHTAGGELLLLQLHPEPTAD
jgi:hypothetical protein